MELTGDTSLSAAGPHGGYDPFTGRRSYDPSRTRAAAVSEDAVVLTVAAARHRDTDGDGFLPSPHGHWCMQVELLDCTPNPEELVCRAARGDYSSDWVGSDVPFAEVMEPVEGETLEEKKRTLMDHLMRSGHWGPFEHPSATFAVRGVSRSCMAQITRHRHASFDVMSLRYVELSEDEPLEERFTYPETFEADEVVSREGAEEVEMPAAERTELADEVYERCIDAYADLVDAGVPKEDARMLLPIGTKVNLTFSMNARALMHLLNMRMKGDAQWEVRELSETVLEEAKEWMPYTFDRYEERHPQPLSP